MPTRLRALRTPEISLVDHPATRHVFAFTKRAGGFPHSGRPAGEGGARSAAPAAACFWRDPASGRYALSKSTGTAFLEEQEAARALGALGLTDRDVLKAMACAKDNGCCLDLVDDTEDIRAAGIDLIIEDSRMLKSMAQKPFSGFDSFGACTKKMKAEGYSDDAASRICGKLKSDTEGKKALASGTRVRTTGDVQGFPEPPVFSSGGSPVPVPRGSKGTIQASDSGYSQVRFDGPLGLLWVDEEQVETAADRSGFEKLAAAKAGQTDTVQPDRAVHELILREMPRMLGNRVNQIDLRLASLESQVEDVRGNQVIWKTDVYGAPEPQGGRRKLAVVTWSTTTLENDVGTGYAPQSGSDLRWAISKTGGDRRMVSRKISQLQKNLLRIRREVTILSKDTASGSPLAAEPSVKEKIKEWTQLQQQLVDAAAAYKAACDPAKERCGELEKELLPVIEAAEGQAMKFGALLLRYVSKPNPRTDWKGLFALAITKVNADLRVLLERLRDNEFTKISPSEELVIEPKLKPTGKRAARFGRTVFLHHYAGSGYTVTEEQANIGGKRFAAGEQEAVIAYLVQRGAPEDEAAMAVDYADTMPGKAYEVHVAGGWMGGKAASLKVGDRVRVTEAQPELPPVPGVQVNAQGIVQRIQGSTALVAFGPGEQHQVWVPIRVLEVLPLGTVKAASGPTVEFRDGLYVLDCGDGHLDNIADYGDALAFMVDDCDTATPDASRALLQAQRTPYTKVPVGGTVPVEKPPVEKGQYDHEVHLYVPADPATHIEVTDLNHPSWELKFEESDAAAMKRVAEAFGWDGQGDVIQWLYDNDGAHVETGEFNSDFSEQYGETTEYEEAAGPNPEDWITEDYVTWTQVEGNWKDRFVVPDGEEWNVALQARMEADSFWPNVWYLDDHGGLMLLDVSTGHQAKAQKAGPQEDPMETWQVILEDSAEAWNNGEPFWEVTHEHDAGTIEISEYASAQEVVDALRAAGSLQWLDEFGVTDDNGFSFEDDGTDDTFVTVTSADVVGMPVAHLHRIKRAAQKASLDIYRVGDRVEFVQDFSWGEDADETVHAGTTGTVEAHPYQTGYGFKLTIRPDGIRRLISVEPEFVRLVGDAQKADFSGMPEIVGVPDAIVRWMEAEEEWWIRDAEARPGEAWDGFGSVRDAVDYLNEGYGVDRQAAQNALWEAKSNPGQEITVPGNEGGYFRIVKADGLRGLLDRIRAWISTVKPIWSNVSRTLDNAIADLEALGLPPGEPVTAAAKANGGNPKLVSAAKAGSADAHKQATTSAWQMIRDEIQQNIDAAHEAFAKPQYGPPSAVRRLKDIANRVMDLIDIDEADNFLATRGSSLRVLTMTAAILSVEFPDNRPHVMADAEPVENYVDAGTYLIAAIDDHLLALESGSRKAGGATKAKAGLVMYDATDGWQTKDAVGATIIQAFNQRSGEFGAVAWMVDEYGVSANDAYALLDEAENAPGEWIPIRGGGYARSISPQKADALAWGHLRDEIERNLTEGDLPNEEADWENDFVQQKGLALLRELAAEVELANEEDHDEGVDRALTIVGNLTDKILAAAPRPMEMFEETVHELWVAVDEYAKMKGKQTRESYGGKAAKAGDGYQYGDWWEMAGVQRNKDGSYFAVMRPGNTTTSNRNGVNGDAMAAFLIQHNAPRNVSVALLQALQPGEEGVIWWQVGTDQWTYTIGNLNRGSGGYALPASELRNAPKYTATPYGVSAGGYGDMTAMGDGGAAKSVWHVHVVDSQSIGNVPGMREYVQGEQVAEIELPELTADAVCKAIAAVDLTAADTLPDKFTVDDDHLTALIREGGPDVQALEVVDGDGQPVLLLERA
jgi:hypothetical protein